jgi:Carboxypeptidase regulatory-like domain/TonB dependent receptor
MFAGLNQTAGEHSSLAPRSLAMYIVLPRLQMFSALLLLVVLTIAAPLWAQKDAGAIVGTVHDPSGAVVTGAKVTVTDVDHGQNFSATTNESGEYVASPLRVGRWVVTVEHAGFKKAVSSPVEINVQDRVAVNVALQVGQVSEQVVVTGTAPLLQTETSELGQVVDSKRMANLPLNGRNFAQLALLSAGTAPSEPGARDEGGFGFSANGARSLQNNFLLDGVDNNSNLPDLLNETNFVIQPPVDALQEFKVESNAYGAEFGRGNGAVINAVIKSGTNEVHGSLWEFLRNDKLDGRNYFDDATKATPPYKQNQFGGTFGGPLYIPGIYNGRNKTFFFFDYEGLRVRQAQTQTALVPSLATRAGDFREFLTNQPALTDPTNPSSPVALDCNGNPTFVGEVFDTRLTRNQSALNPNGFCGVPFTVNGQLNMIPATSQNGGGFLDPLAQQLAALYPSPGTLFQGNNFLANPVLKESRTNFDIRVDEKFNDNNFSFFRFSYEDQPRTIPGTFPGFADGGGFFSGQEENSYRSFATSWTHIFRPQLINEFRLGYNRINSQRAQLFANVDVSQQLGFPGVPFAPGIGGLPQLAFDDGSAPQLGSPTFLPSKELQNSYTLSDNLTWVKGSHTLKYGTEIRREEFTIFQPASPRGNLGFSTTLTDNPASPGTGGSGFASFMAGLTDGGGINNLHNVDYFRQTYAFYAQDDWKVSPRLALNVGVRYELFLPVTERHDQVATFDLTNPGSPTLILPKDQNAQLTPTIAQAVQVSATGSKGLVNTDLNNFAPRFGFAFQLNPKAVLRAGYGIFYGGQENGPYSNPSPGFNPPFFKNEAFISPCSAPSANPSISVDCTVQNIRFLSNGFPSTALTDPNTPILFSVDQKLRTPYMQQWHMSVQQELPWNSLLEITYAGSKGTKLYTFFNGNQAAPSVNSSDATAPRRPVFASLPGKGPCDLKDDDASNCNPVFDTSIDWFRSTGKSVYHSLQAHYEKRLTRGLQFQASYTWAHSIDTASNANLGPTQNNSDFRDFRHPEAERGNSDFDVRHRFVAGFLYELPMGHGKSLFGDAQGAWNQIVGGWQLASIVTLSTGNWFTVLDGNGNFANADGGAGGVSQRPDQVGDPHATPCIPGTFFNTCAYADPAQGSFGNVGRNTIQGPGNRVWDFSTFKFFKLSEHSNLEFRAEFFNVLNHTNFLFSQPGPQNGNPATVLGDPHFGLLTASRAPRQIQLAMKFSF